MNLLFPVAIAVAALSQPAMAPVSPMESSATAAVSECPSATSHFARKGGVWNGDPMKPHKLAELPPADTYAAVYRHDERGCMVPVMYRDVRPSSRR